MMSTIAKFAFVVAIPLVIVGATVAGLFAVGALFNALEHPEELKTRVEGLFRRPPKPARPTAPDHYYKPYWNS
jgi:hypothetical protein